MTCAMKLTCSCLWKVSLLLLLGNMIIMWVKFHPEVTQPRIVQLPLTHHHLRLDSDSPHRRKYVSDQPWNEKSTADPDHRTVDERIKTETGLNHQTRSHLLVSEPIEDTQDSLTHDNEATVTYSQAGVDPNDPVLDLDRFIERAKSSAPQMDYQARVLQYLRYYKQFRHEYNHKTNKKKDILCSTFIQLNSAGVDSALSNILHSDNQCDWLIMIYKHDDSNKDAMFEQFHKDINKAIDTLNNRRSRGKQPIQVTVEYAIRRDELLTSISSLCDKHMKRDVSSIIKSGVEIDDIEWLRQFNPCDNSDFSLPAVEETLSTDTAAAVAAAAAAAAVNNNVRNAVPFGIGLQYNHLTYPKILMFISYIPYLSKYNYIWSLDGDLSLLDFDMKTFKMIINCAFRDHIPLVSQPLIADNTQQYHYLNAQSWVKVNAGEMTESNRSILAAVTGFVEIQAPLFDSYFLEFYIQAFLIPLLAPTHILGADWGYDELFCKAAQAFAESSLGLSRHDPLSKNNSVPCALIAGGTALHHENQQVTNSMLGVNNKFALNGELVRLISRLFPAYTQPGNGGAANPLTGSHQVRSYGLQEECTENG